MSVERNVTCLDPASRSPRDGTFENLNVRAGMLANSVPPKTKHARVIESKAGCVRYPELFDDFHCLIGFRNILAFVVHFRLAD